MEESQDHGSSKQNEGRQYIHACRKAAILGTNNTQRKEPVPKVLRAIVEVLAVTGVGVLSAIHRVVSITIANFNLQAGL